MKKINIGIIGYGQRGEVITDLLLDYFADDAKIVAICDIVKERAEKGAVRIKEKSGGIAQAFTDYRRVIDSAPDLIIITSSWADHIEISVACMKAGIPVACEVGGCYNLEEIHKLIDTYEKTETPYCFMENCCYGRIEQLALNMKKLGILGDIVHCEGGYCHDLRNEISNGIKANHYRLSEYSARNTHNYPSHDFLPIAKLLDLNNGNRPISLYSMSSKAVGLKEYIKTNYPKDEVLNNLQINQGDIVTTVIRFAFGQTVTLTLDTTLPRAYSRKFTVHGTKGAVFEDTKSVFLDGVHNKYEFDWSDCWNNMDEYFEKYDSEIWKEYHKNPRGSHDGMDFLTFSDLFSSLRNNSKMNCDVYDAAFTLAIPTLSEMSIATGGTVAFPDFTKGKWIKRMEKI